MIYKQCIQCKSYRSIGKGIGSHPECENCGYPRIITTPEPKKWETKIQIWNDSLTRRLGFNTDPTNSALGLTSEVGELTDIIRKLNGMKKVKVGDEKATVDGLASEIADVLVYLLQIATHYDIDIHNAFMDKVNIIDKRAFQ